ncbi:MAG: choice-of-anchor D domain-containing protein [Bacteroidota bacterium]
MKTFTKKIKCVAFILLCLGSSINTQAQWTQRGNDIDGEAADDRSGQSVSLSSNGNTLAIGAPFNDGTGTDAGQVRVYTWNGTAWAQRGNDIDGEAADDFSGISVSLSSDGNTLAIGANGNDGTGSLAGHVRVYTWNGTAWVQRGDDIDGEAAGDQSGFSVSLSSNGNTLAIGAPSNGGTAPNAGHVRVYTWNGTAWAQRGNDIDGEAANDRSGRSVSLSSDGNTLAIGAPLNDGIGSTAGQVRVYTWNGTAWAQRGNDIDGEAEGDQSGFSVSLSSDGNTLAIGAQLNDGTGTSAGQVRVYTWNGTAWIQRGSDIDGEAAFDRSGISVSLSSDGNTLAIGAIDNNGTDTNAGQARVYTWDGTAWTQRGSDIDGEAGGDNSGFPVFLSSDGNTLAIGAFGNDGNGSAAGHVRVYNFLDPSINTQAQWAQCGNDIDGETADDLSGWSVSLSADGNTLAIGATNNDGTDSDAGHVRVYTWNGTAWTQRGNDIDGEAEGDRSGFSVSLSSDGNTLAIGTPQNDGMGSLAGHVRVYTWNGTAWTQRGNDIDGEAAFDQSGWSVSLSADGNTLAIGAIFNDGTAPDAGHVRVYTWNGTAWAQRGNDIDGEAADDRSGQSVSLSADGNTLAIGAIFNDGTDTNAGHVRVYTWNGTAWTQRGNDIDGEAENDVSGGSVSLSSDGNILAIGASFNDGNGSNAGHVRVYTWNGTAWTQRGNDIDGEAADDRSGSSVSLSSDGNTLAVGATRNDGNGTDAGHVRVYTWNGTAWTQRGSDIDGEAEDDRSGLSVSLSSDGNTLAIGARRNDGNGSNAGHVRVYKFPDPEINLKQGNTAIASGEAYDFGEVDANTSSDEVSFTLENTGTADLELSGTAGNLVVLSGTDADQFSVDQTQVTSPLAAGSDQTFTVTFSPTSEGEKTATLTITSNDDDEGTYTLNLSGTSVAVPVGNPEINLRQGNSAIASGETYNFGEVDTNTSSAEVAFTLENTGTTDLVLSGVAGSLIVLAGTGADQFSVNQTDVTSPIASGSSQTFTVTFSPTSEGEKTATLIITSNDADEGTYTFNLSGIGVVPGSPEPEINLRQGETAIASGESYDFGEVDANTSSSEVAFILENIGDADLELSGTAGSLVALSGTDADQFSIDQTDVTSPLTAGSDQPFTVSFSPTSEGEKTATLTITSNDADEGTYTLILNGTGMEIITSLLGAEKESIMIYPNPTPDRVIAKNLPVGKNSFVLTDVLGNTILAGEISNILELNMSELTAGTYTLTFTTGEQVFIKKILKY